MFWIWTLKGTQSATAGTAPEMKAVTASGMRWLMIVTSFFGSSPFFVNAVSRKTCAVVPIEVAIFLPFSSSNDDTPIAGLTHSCAVANSTSLMRNTLPWPRAGKFETTAPVASMSSEPPTIAWNSSSPV